MDGIGLWIAVFVVNLLLYPLARKRPPENRFLVNLTFWKWVLYSLAITVATLIVYKLFRALGLFSDG